MLDTYLLLGEVLMLPATAERPAGAFVVVGRSHYKLPDGTPGTLYELAIAAEWARKAADPGVQCVESAQHG